MRHVLLALLIALLPLRGWVGDAMAMAGVAHPTAQAQEHPASPAPGAHEPLAHAHAHASLVAAVVVGETASAPADHVPCDEHGGAAHAAAADTPTASTDASPPPNDGHHTAASGETTHQHKSCDVCNGPALALSGEPAATRPQPHQVHAATAVRFASTVLPQGIKPPIS